MIPPRAVPVTGKTLQAYDAVLAGATTFEEVRLRCGLASNSTVMDRLLNAEQAGLLTWERRTRGTLRPLVRVVLNP